MMNPLCSFEECNGSQLQILIDAIEKEKNSSSVSTTNIKGEYICFACKTPAYNHKCKTSLTCTRCDCGITQENFQEVYSIINIMNIMCLLCKCPAICHPKNEDELTNMSQMTTESQFKKKKEY